MVSYVTNYLQETAMGYLQTGITAAGTMAGNTVGGVGGLIENGGRSVAQGTQGITGGIGGVGSYINNYGNGVRDKFAADGPVGASASQKARREPSEATKPAYLPASAQKKLPDASAPGAAVTGAARKILPASAQPKPSAKVQGQARAAAADGKTPAAAGAAGGKPSAPTARNAGSKTARPPVESTARAKPGVSTGSGKAPVSASKAITPKPPTAKPGSAGVKNNPPGANGKVKISPASRPKPAVGGAAVKAK